MTVLLDGNMLVAVTIADHLHHGAAEAWLAEHRSDGFATTPITQGTLLRMLIRNGVRAVDAVDLMTRITADRHHHFWADDVAYSHDMMRGVIGHRQVTDAYLASLTRHRGGRIATFDAGFASAHPDVADLVPAS